MFQSHYCDATIVCQGKFFKVHRFILSTCSEYFEEIFENTECNHPFIIIKDIDAQEIEALLNYMYLGEVNVLQEILPSLIKAAEALRIRGLAVCDDDIIKSTSEKNPPVKNSSENSKKRERSNVGSDQESTPKKVLKQDRPKSKNAKQPKSIQNSENNNIAVNSFLKEAIISESVEV